MIGNIMVRGFLMIEGRILDSYDLTSLPTLTIPRPPHVMAARNKVFVDALSKRRLLCALARPRH